MIVYSVTVSVLKSVETEWLKWMQEMHIPEVLATGYFTEAHSHRLLDPPSQDPNAATYNFQYIAENMEQYDIYQEKEAPRLKKDHSDRFPNQVFAFRSLLERI